MVRGSNHNTSPVSPLPTSSRRHSLCRHTLNSVCLNLFSHNKISVNFSIYQEFVFMFAARAAVGSVKYFHREGGTKSYMNKLSIAKSAFAFIKHIVFTEPDVGLERSDVSMLPKAGHFPQTTSIS